MFGFTFPGSLSQEQLQQRRESLDFHARLAQLSVVFVLVAVRVRTILARVYDDQNYAKDRDQKLGSQSSGASGLRKAWIKWRWIMGNRCQIASYDLGTNGEALAGVSWLAWLLYLCLNDTNSDYLHLTKRFGVVAASQLPLHYMLAIKSSWSPIQLVVRRSHEELNVWHQMLGRIIQLLLTLHAMFYLNFYVQMGLLSKRIMDADVQIGLAGAILLTVLGSSALVAVRRANYRAFYMLHVAISMAFLPLMYFHVSHIRVYLLESAAVYALHVALRLASTSSHTAILTSESDGGLVKVEVPVTKSRQAWSAGQHVYLKLPTYGKLRQNPYTVASLPDEDGRITLVARVLKGNTRYLANAAEGDGRLGRGSSISVEIEGPYGASRLMPSLTSYDHILLVAGGIGATYIIPIWRTLMQKSQHSASQTIKLVWTVRDLAETRWASEFLNAQDLKGTTTHNTYFDVYVTGQRSSHDRDRLELRDLSGRSTGTSEDISSHIPGIEIHQNTRPNFREISDDFLSSHSSASTYAVLVCGPPGMSGDLRDEFGRWVDKGIDIFWHAEEFGFGS